MQTSKVKICGITTARDALLAEQMGADYIGLIFARQSLRCVTIDKARAIIAQLKTAKPVGVFVEQDYNKTLEIARAVSLWGIQHYSYFPQKFDGFNYIYAVRMGAPNAPKDLSSLSADYLLLDSYDENQHGGTGKTFDWSQLAELDKRRTFLAGGLGPLNICAAARISPYALDLSSSVEISPGIKDPNKLQQLFENLRDCDVTNPEEPAGS